MTIMPAKKWLGAKAHARRVEAAVASFSGSPEWGCSSCRKSERSADCPDCAIQGKVCFVCRDAWLSTVEVLNQQKGLEADCLFCK